jgi:Ca2+-binding RTX toxin-like protein
MKTQYLDLLKVQLPQLAAQANFASIITTAFGKNIEPAKIQQLRQDWLQGDFSVIPPIEILSGGELGVASGGYAASEDKIFISSDFLAQQQGNMQAATGLLLEELGHKLDRVFNGDVDSPGDEGDTFSRLASGQKLSPEMLASLKLEDDRAVITVGGKAISIEQGLLPPLIGSNSDDLTWDVEFPDFDRDLYGRAGNDRLYGYGGNDRLFGEIGNDTLYGGDGNDTLYGDGNEFSPGEIGNDILYGGSGNDTLYGYGGNDRLFGEIGNDTLYGGDGNDTYFFASSDTGVKTIDDSSGNDTLDFVLMGNTKVSIDLNQTTIQTVANGLQFVLGSSIENINSGQGSDLLLGNSLGNQIVGNDGNDSLYGDAGNDRLFGEIGKDILVGGTGNDFLSGGAEEDRLYGDADEDTLYGDAGNDILAGGSESDYLYGGTGDDTLYGGTGKDHLYGGDNNDTLYGGDEEDRLAGGSESDYLYGDAGTDYLNGEDGDDFLYGGSDRDVLNGEAGNDTLYGEAGNDSLYGGNGDDYLNGGTGDDTLQGGNDNDSLSGGADNDSLYGEAGNDTLYGEAGNDRLVGDTGTDSLFGGADIDTLYGGSESDYLYGDAGTDTLYGDAGNDTLYGGAGNDTLYGGADNDKFYFGTPFTFPPAAATTVTALGRDIIGDFVTGIDKIVLSKSTFTNVTTTLGMLSNFAIVSDDNVALNGKSSAAILYSASTRNLFYNENGLLGGLGANGGNFAMVVGLSNLVANDFMVVG